MEWHRSRRCHARALRREGLGLQFQRGSSRDPWRLRGTQWLLQVIVGRALQGVRSRLAHGRIMDVSALGEGRLLAAGPVVLSDDWPGAGAAIV